MRADVYQKITDQIVAELEKGVRPWFKPWNAEHAAGRITRPLRGNGIPYQGINVLMLWSAAMAKGYAAPIWMTFKQALDLGAHVRKGEEGSLVVYADKIVRTETDAATGEEAERAIPFMKGYTVFNVEQIDSLPEHYYAKPAPRTEAVQRIEHAEAFFAATGATVRHGGTMALYSITHDHVQMPPIRRRFAMRKVTTRRLRMRRRTGRGTPRGSIGISGASDTAMKATRWKSWLPNLAPPSFPPTLT